MRMCHHFNENEVNSGRLSGPNDVTRRGFRSFEGRFKAWGAFGRSAVVQLGWSICVFVVLFVFDDSWWCGKFVHFWDFTRIRSRSTALKSPLTLTLNPKQHNYRNYYGFFLPQHDNFKTIFPIHGLRSDLHPSKTSLLPVHGMSAKSTSSRQKLLHSENTSMSPTHTSLLPCLDRYPPQLLQANANILALLTLSRAEGASSSFAC